MPIMWSLQYPLAALLIKIYLSFIIHTRNEKALSSADRRASSKRVKDKKKSNNKRVRDNLLVDAARMEVTAEEKEHESSEKQKRERESGDAKLNEKAGSIRQK